MPTGKQRHMTPEEEKLYHEELTKALQLRYVDDCMESLGQSLNLLDPDGTFKGMPSEEVLTKIMQAVRGDYRKLSGAIRALRKRPFHNM